MDIRTLQATLAGGALALLALAGCGGAASSGTGAGGATSSAPSAAHRAEVPGSWVEGADSAIDDGSAAAGPWSRRLLPTAADLVEFGETRTPWKARPVTTGLPQVWLRPCRDAAGSPVRAGYVEAASRDFTTTDDGSVGGNPQAQAVLLDYPSEQDAAAAYADLASTYQGCSGVLVGDGARHVSKTRSAAVPLGAFGSGPNAAAARTFMVTYAAPAEEHAVTQLQHGIAVDGSHLLVVTITQDTQDYWPDLAASMPKIVEHFGRTRGLPRRLTFPTQLDYVRLGESYAQAMAGGDLVTVRAGGQVVHALRPYARVRHSGGETSVDGEVCVSRPHGVEAIWMPAPVRTAEGIGIGSTAAQVRHAYPNTTTDTEGYLDHRLWGGKDAAAYHFGVRHGKVFEWSVELVRQHCYD